MGGKAFDILPATAFPRIPPAVYQALKTRLLPSIQLFYSLVAVPHEAPGKPDHGDLDFVVAGPKMQKKSKEGTMVNLPHEDVSDAIGAEYFIPMDGNRTSNFAVPIQRGEWSALGHEKEEEEYRRVAEGDGKIYYQIDVHVCLDEAEWERVVFFHAYGDLGMILGLIARNNGLAVGTKGLRLLDPPNPPFHLSGSFEEITDFMGLSMDDWKAGFNSNQDIFRWAGSSRLFNPRRFRTAGIGATKVKTDRKMYAEFLQWVETHRREILSRLEVDEERVKDEALVYFNKKEEFEALAHERSAKVRLKDVFNGNKVRDWTGLGVHWRGVKMIMDRVRQQAGEDAGVLAIFDREGEMGVKKAVLNARDELGLTNVNTVPNHDLEAVTSGLEKVAITEHLV